MGCCNDEPGVYELVRDLFCAAAVTCFLLALHRIANGLMLGSQIDSFKSFEDAYTPEEREALIHRIKVESLNNR
jgi:hypothetical protein